MNEKDLKKQDPAQPQEVNEEQIAAALTIAEEAIHSMQEYIGNIVEDFRKNDQKEGNSKLSELIEIINLFVQLVSQIKEKSPEYEKVEDQVPEIESHLLDTVKEVFSVKQKDDDTALCDLLEYELGDNLERWHKKVIQPLLN